MISIRYGRLLGKPNEMFAIVIVSLTGFPPTGMLVLYGQHGSNGLGGILDRLTRGGRIPGRALDALQQVPNTPSRSRRLLRMDKNKRRALQILEKEGGHNHRITGKYSTETFVFLQVGARRHQHHLWRQ